MRKGYTVNERGATRYFFKRVLMPPIGHRPRNLPFSKAGANQRFVARKPAYRQRPKPQRELEVALGKRQAAVCVDLNKNRRRRKLFQRRGISMKRLYLLKCRAKYAALLIGVGI